MFRLPIIYVMAVLSSFICLEGGGGGGLAVCHQTQEVWLPEGSSLSKTVGWLS